MQEKIKLYSIQTFLTFKTISKHMYQPSKTILEKYAEVLVKFALNSGKGVKPGEVVMCIADDDAKLLLLSLHKKILEARAHPMLRMIPSGIDRTFYEIANDKQLTFFPRDYTKAQCNLIDHQIGILSDADPQELKGIPPQKMMKSADARKEARQWLDEKEYKGKFTWTLALYGTKAMAKEAGLTLKQYWDVIIKGCYLDKKDPVKEWKRLFAIQEKTKKKLNALKIDHVHMTGEHCDITIKLGKNRKWLGGSGRNIPSFELFISPDWRGTNGYIKFNQPLYHYGNIIRDVELWFKNGKVIKAKASKGQDVVHSFIKRRNADKLGEYSLTDARLSRITHFMANTLFDENIGGKYGNTHLALGMSYKDSFTGDYSKPSKKKWAAMGFNDSDEHTDIISTEDRTVTAYLSNGATKVIYKNGRFTV